MIGIQREQYVALALTRLILAHCPQYIFDDKIPDNVDIAEYSSDKLCQFIHKTSQKLQKNNTLISIDDFDELLRVLSFETADLLDKNHQSENQSLQY